MSVSKRPSHGRSTYYWETAVLTSLDTLVVSLALLVVFIIATF
jgi:hypothetical protein